ncbi:DUF4062 domain-containing protein [Pseudomonas sp. PDM27]|uniref:DUF4062 domain-containing protein n=1 Tax=Pseudomonas sp. PDM27 TaxID=2854769 RepID=UPI001C484CBF|nr:DUF4062 domain-containing protein [Pseudomonas sp. PDM27]MBV7568880.1 DUF4062 domain-containing protein [Pseudomonas sp. PDM27]
MSKKYQVFISSTYQDLVEEREQVIKAVLEMGHIPVGMEMFSAADEEQWKIIARQIDEIDYYAVIVAHRYGSVTPEGIGYTEKEYDYAIEKGVPILGFVIDNSAPWPRDRCETETKAQQRLASFKIKVKSRLVNFWSSKDDLHGKFSISLMKAITGNPRTGWIRADQVTGAEVTKELTRLSSENASLREQIEKIKRAEDTQVDEVRSAIRILSANKRSLGARTRDKPKWEDVTFKEVTLADVFHWVAKNMIVENSSEDIGKNIALHLEGPSYALHFPIGKNIVIDILADLAALELVEPSKKKHSVSDTASYWSLTKLGKQVLKEFRRVLLEEGIQASEILTETE